MHLLSDFHQADFLQIAKLHFLPWLSLENVLKYEESSFPHSDQQLHLTQPIILSEIKTESKNDAMSWQNVNGLGHRWFYTKIFQWGGVQKYFNTKRSILIFYIFGILCMHLWGNHRLYIIQMTSSTFFKAVVTKWRW